MFQFLSRKDLSSPFEEYSIKKEKIQMRHFSDYIWFFSSSVIWPIGAVPYFPACGKYLCNSCSSGEEDSRLNKYLLFINNQYSVGKPSRHKSIKKTFRSTGQNGFIRFRWTFDLLNLNKKLSKLKQCNDRKKSFRINVIFKLREVFFLFLLGKLFFGGNREWIFT